MSATSAPASAQALRTAPPANPSPAHELKTLVLSRHPLIVVETTEEQRVDSLVAEVAADLRVHRFEWTVTGGLVRAGETGRCTGRRSPPRSPAPCGPVGRGHPRAEGPLPHLAASAGPGAARLSRAFRDTAEVFAAPGRLSTMVLTGAGIELPPELEAICVRFRLALPAAEDYRQTVLATLRGLEESGQARVEIGSATCRISCRRSPA